MSRALLLLVSSLVENWPNRPCITRLSTKQPRAAAAARPPYCAILPVPTITAVGSLPSPIACRSDIERCAASRRNRRRQHAEARPHHSGELKNFFIFFSNSSVSTLTVLSANLFEADLVVGLRGAVDGQLVAVLLDDLAAVPYLVEPESSGGTLKKVTEAGQLIQFAGVSVC